MVFALPDRYEAEARVFVDTRTALKPALQGLTTDQNVDAQINFVRQSLLEGPQLESIAKETGVLLPSVTDERARAQVLDGFRRQFGDDHPATLFARHQLAWMMANVGRWGDAEAGLRQVLAARRGLFGNSHSATLTTRHELAWTIGSQCRWAEAEAAFHEIVLAKRQTFGHDHPDTLATRHNLAWTMAVQGRWPEAEVIWRDVLEAKCRIFGDDHPITQTTRRALALARI